MSIQFRFGNSDYRVDIVEGVKSDITISIGGVVYSVLAEQEQLQGVRELFRSISLDSLSSVRDLSERIGAVDGYTAVKTQAVGIEIFNSVSPVTEVETRLHAVETGIIRSIPIRGDSQTVSIEQRMSELNIPGVGIAVINNGKIDWSSGYGQFAQPILSQAASISKTVNALAVLSLIDQCRKAGKAGKPSGLIENKMIDLDTDVSTLLDPDLWHSIDPKGILDGKDPKMTIRQLLSHTAGTSVHGFDGYLREEEIEKEIQLLTDRIHLSSQEKASPLSIRLEELKASLSNPRKPIPTLDDILRGKGNSDPVTVVNMPGTKYEYSGGGTTILQKVVEIVTGRSFEEVVQSKVLDRLEMRDSTYHPGRLPPSSGYSVDGSPTLGQWRIHPELAAAGLWTTPADLAKMSMGIQQSVAGADESILSPELAYEMVSPQIIGGENGLGVFVKKTGLSTYFFHGGSNAGFRCFFIANSVGQGAMVMTNSDLGDAIGSEIIAAIATVYQWPDKDSIPNPSPSFSEDEIEAMKVPLDMEKWKDAVGKYQYQEHVIKVSLLGDKIFVQIDQSHRFELMPLTKDIGSYQSPMFGLGVIRFQKMGDLFTVLNIFGADHKKIE